jgi:hypothetical protein
MGQSPLDCAWSDDKARKVIHAKRIAFEFIKLIQWAKARYGKGGSRPFRWLEGIVQMFGTGRDVWKGEDPDEYVRKLRERWG